MIDVNDWRLLNNVEHLFDKYLNPLNGEDIIEFLSHIKRCRLCLDSIEDDKRAYWYVPEMETSRWLGCLLEFILKLRVV